MSEIDSNDQEMLTSIAGDEQTIYPTISGPYSVTSGTFENWFGYPDMSSCSGCAWRWDTSEDNISWTIGVDGPDSDNQMSHFLIGAGDTHNDFYLRLAIRQSGVYYYSDTIFIEVD